jgi:hypothetical protein
MVLTLVGNISPDDIVGDLSAAAAEIAARPDVSPPVPFSDLGKFTHQNVGTLSLQLLYQSTNRDLRRNREHHVDVIGRTMALQNINALSPALFPNDISYPLSHRPT